jgi:hypothetical protein
MILIYIIYFGLMGILAYFAKKKFRWYGSLAVCFGMMMFWQQVIAKELTCYQLASVGLSCKR